jgi:putative ABC transport system permease protein
MSARLATLLPEIARMAAGSLRSHPMRSMLTTLGVVIGVGTVVAMASIVKGFDRTVETSFSSFGTNTIYVRKLKPDLFVGGFPDSLRHRHAFTPEDAEAIRRRCPDVREVSIVGFAEALSLSFGGSTTRGIQVLGADPAIQTVNVYDPWLGRFFTGEELRRSAAVVVLGRDVREALFRGGDPIGRTIHIGRVPFRVVGELEPKGKSLFFNPDEVVTIPYTTLAKYFPPPADAPFYVPARGEYYLNAIPVSSERTGAAIDEIVEVLRQRRGLDAREANDFAVFSEEALTDLYQQLTGATFIVMLLISSIALLVGGIGVMNIMLVAVTERTREIGLRKALGAPRSAILTQFLLEAATLTGLGGLLGIALGAGVAQVVRATTGLPAYTPPWSVAVAFTFSVVVGLFFGLYPAIRASTLDPVEALRWE